MRIRLLPLIVAACCAVIGACDGTPALVLPATGVALLETPSGDGARFPFLASDSSGRVVLSWVERDADSVPSVRFSVRRPGEPWRQPETLVRDTALLVNFADFASVVPVNDGRLVGQWLRRGSAPHAYDLFLAQSVNDGDIWSVAVNPHGNTRPAEHGFASIYSEAGGGAAVAFLDGSVNPDSVRAMALRHVEFDASAAVHSASTVDDRVCDCCQTDAAMTSRGPIVVYRDRSSEEIRDIAIARRDSGGWVSTRVFADDWHINGCPVNGPAVAADGDRVVVAWFTAARDTTRVRLAFSPDAGVSFGVPSDLVVGPTALGRVDVAWLADGRALVVWLERGSRETADVRVAAVMANGRVDWSGTVGRTDAGRRSGFPRMAKAGDDVLLAWTRTGTPTRIVLASVTAR